MKNIKHNQKMKSARKSMKIIKIKRKIKTRKTVCHISSIHTSLFYVHDDWFLYDHVFT